MNKRLPYLDVAKGLLIILVLIHHLPHVMFISGIKDNGLYNGIDDADYFYRPYFMPAFFFITGYCTRFKFDYIFFVKNIKSLIVPSFILGFICKLITNFSVETLYSYIKFFILTGGSYWFITSLFICKITFVSLMNYKHISLICPILGFLFHIYELPNPYYLHQSLFLIVFIYLGDYFKGRLHCIVSLRNMILCSLIYVITILLIFNQIIPSVTMVINIGSLFETLLFILLAITGICIIINISYYIQNNSLLIYIGKNTIAIYMFHILIYTMLVNVLHISLVQNTDIQTSLLLFISILLVTLIYCCFIAYCLNLRYLKFIIGKF